MVAISVLGLCDGELMGDDRPSIHKVNAMEGTSFAKYADDQVTMASATRLRQRRESRPGKYCTCLSGGVMLS